MTLRMITASAAVLFATASAAHAVQIIPTSYDMPNGNSGSYHYWDESYSGSGATGNPAADGSALAGGMGDLTDGIIATQNWYITEAPISTPGPYVGWTISPTITFHFAGTPTIDEVRFYFDDADNGGVVAPASVVVDGLLSAVTDPPANSDPFLHTVSGLNIAKSSFDVTLNSGGPWVFISEIEFYGPSTAPEVPLPAPLALLGAGIVALGIAGRRKHR